MKPLVIRKRKCGHWGLFIIKDLNDFQFAAAEILHEDEFGDILVMINNPEFCEDIEMALNV